MTTRFDRPTVILLGGRGFVGSAIATQLARLQTSLIIPSRRINDTPLRVLPNVRWLEMDIHQDAQLDELLAMADDAVVINLVGILHDKEAKPYGPGFARAHVELPQRLISAMHRRGLRRLLHMSALGADPQGCSMYQRSKGEGERCVRQSDLDWTIFRPSVIFGRHDHFINFFASMQSVLPLVPLAGANVEFQPVAVQDVAQAFIKSIGMPQTVHNSFDLAGPHVYTLEELVRFSGVLKGHPRLVMALPASLAWLQALLMEYMPGPPLLSRDNLRSMQIDNILPDGYPNALVSVFGMTPTTLTPQIYR